MDSDEENAVMIAIFGGAAQFAIDEENKINIENERKIRKKKKCVFVGCAIG